MSLTVNKGAVAVFKTPKVTEYEYELTEHDTATEYNSITESAMLNVLNDKLLYGVHGTPYYFTYNSATQYIVGYPTNQGTTQETYTITYADGHTETVTRSYLINFLCDSRDTAYLSAPAHVTGLLSSYYEPPTNSAHGMALTSDRTKWESRTALNRLHLFYMTENLVLERDSQGGVIGYHFDPEMVEIIDTYRAAHYGTYWLDNDGLAGNTVDIELEMTETVVDNA